ncbi:MAG: glycosyltransferase family 4 protein [Rhodobiaceae bacterium]|nr:glycosyltransferase family 4 protein [Rhodobiaceae bacterium]MCC0040722.1 glycosyltransferase family 4 protein [Rhodobiaceae bacterium]
MAGWDDCTRPAQTQTGVSGNAMPDEHGAETQGPPLRVLLCPDKPDWSFDNIANNITRHAGPNRIHKLYMNDVIGNERVFFETIFLNRIDLCHVFWREDLFYMLHPHTIDKAAGQLGLEYETMVRAINSCAFTTSVYDHLFSDDEEMEERLPSFAMVDGYTVSSPKLRDIYAAKPGMPLPDAIVPDGVDTERFSPPRVPRSSPGHHRVGWVGNSAWGKQAKGYDVKGHDRVFLPMLEMLEARGLAVEASVADPRVRQIAFEEMPAFYQALDVFVCTSAMEGTPNPVLEAMATGVPVVSTDVGIVAEVFGDLQKPFLLRDAGADAFADAVSELLADGDLRIAIGRENRARALDWSWERQVRGWWPFWRETLRRTAENRHAIRRQSYLLAQAAIL